MKILLLSDLNSAHTQKWATALAGEGIEVGIFTLNEADSDWWNGYSAIRVFRPLTFSRKRIAGNPFSKLVYLKAISHLKRVIREFRPDVVHAHYATSYGLLGALSGFRPFIISVWGSDVMNFPQRSFFHRQLLQFNFRKADLLLSTSKAIADCIQSLTAKPTEIVHFGIDTNVFVPGMERIIGEAEDLVIGTVKSLEPIYGIDILLKAFHVLSNRHPGKRLKLLIVGGGSLSEAYQTLASELGIAHLTTFTGKVTYEKVPFYIQNLDIFANLSRNESFGVAVLEAEACGKPVVVTAVGGLKEVMLPGITGFAVPPEQVEETALAFERLLDEKLRKQLGAAGRQFVLEKYTLEKGLSQLIDLYKKLLLR